MAITVLREYRRPPGTPSADRVGNVPAGVVLLFVTLLCLACSGRAVAAMTGQLDNPVLGPGQLALYLGVAAVSAVTGIALLSRSLPRTVGIVGGWVLLALAVCAALAAIGFGSRLVHGDPRWAVLAGALALAFGLLAAGRVRAARWLLRGNRHLCLFLRRFGFVEATGQVSAVVEGRAGATWRVVTLDDSRVAAVGSGRRSRWLVAVAVAVPVLLAFAISYVGLSLRDRSLVWGSVVGFVLYGSLAVAAVAVFAWLSARRSLRDARLAVAAAPDVAVTVGKVRRNNARVLSPRVVVCGVADPQWRDTVLALAYESDAVVIDVSQPSESVQWEVESLLASGAPHCVFVCHESTVDSLVAAGPLDGSPRSRLAWALDGRDLLVYGHDPAEFATSLRARLDEAAMRRRAVPRPR